MSTCGMEWTWTPHLRNHFPSLVLVLVLVLERLAAARPVLWRSCCVNSGTRCWWCCWSRSWLCCRWAVLTRTWSSSTWWRRSQDLGDKKWKWLQGAQDVRGVQDEQFQQGAGHLGSKMRRPLPVQASAVEARQHLQIITFVWQICFKNCSRLRFLLWVIDELMNIKITLNEISVGGLLLT